MGRRCRDRLRGLRARWKGGRVVVDHASEWRVILAARGGAFLMPDRIIELNRVPTDAEPADVKLYTRYQDVGLETALPRELLFDVRITASSIDEAFGKAGVVAGGLAIMISFAVNAYVDMPQKWIAFQNQAALSARQYAQNYVVFETEMPHAVRAIKADLLLPYLEAVIGAAEGERLARAITQYNLALNYWSARGRPLTLAHLYMAIEALAPAVESRLRQAAGYPSKEAHAAARGVDLTEQNWNGLLLARIRRDEICRGDTTVYNEARKASDGFEHGFMAYEDIRSAAEQHTEVLLGYVRDAIVDLLDLTPDQASELKDKTPVDISPFVPRIEGELVGRVLDQNTLAMPDFPFPFADFSATLDSVQLADEQYRIEPRSTVTMRFNDGVAFKALRHGTDLGLNSPEALAFEPGGEQPATPDRDEPLAQ